MSETLENYRFKDQQEYKEFLDQKPLDEWLQLRDLGEGQKHIYLPLFIQEANADFVFKEWQVIDETFMGMQGGVLCTVKIQALPDYPGSDYITFTGTAGIMFKTAKKTYRSKTRRFQINYNTSGGTSRVFYFCGRSISNFCENGH